MKKSELKQVVKHLVRESLIEIFAEMKLETIVESAVKKHIKTSSPVTTNKRSIAEALEVAPSSAPVSKEDMRQKMMETMGVDEDTWRNIYEDTAESDNPVLTGDDSDRPELVSEAKLKSSGLMRDYSKFVE
jgi:hypothetical protein